MAVLLERARKALSDFTEVSVSIPDCTGSWRGGGMERRSTAPKMAASLISLSLSLVPPSARGMAPLLLQLRENNPDTDD